MSISITEMELALASAKAKLAAEARAERLSIEAVYKYKTVKTTVGFSIVGTLQNKKDFSTFFNKYGYIQDEPNEKTNGIEHVYTVDGYLVPLGGGFIQPQLDHSKMPIKVSLEEYKDILNSVYPVRLGK